MYSIPEDPAENFIDEHYSDISLSVQETSVSYVKQTILSTSLSEETTKISKSDLNCSNTSVSTSTTPAIKIQLSQDVEKSEKSHKAINKRLSTSLIDFCDFRVDSDSGTLQTDRINPSANMASSNMNSAQNSASYLEVQDCISNSNHEPEYEELLSEKAISASNAKRESYSVKTSYECQTKERKISEKLIIIDLNSESEEHHSIDTLPDPSLLRQRSQSMQWIQNAFQNVSNKYRDLLEFRRPSDIVEERIRKSQEGLEMDEPEYEELSTSKKSPAAGGRRFSENILGKQKRFPFSSRLVQLKDFWKDRNFATKRQEEKDIDQTRTDVCPLFTFPKKGDEDEQILDALRQAMRKCTTVDPTSRPTSTTVLDQLSTLLH